MDQTTASVSTHKQRKQIMQRKLDLQTVQYNDISAVLAYYAAIHLAIREHLLILNVN